MPGRKRIKNEDKEKVEDKSLIVKLPIKIHQDENTTDNEELDSLRKENEILKEKLYLYTKNNKVNLLKNKPKKGKLKCWWCNGGCDNKLVLPEKRYKDSFSGRGVFCSLSCMVSYNFELGDENVWTRYSLIYMLKDSIRSDLDKISPAPPKEVLKEFGGEMEREIYDEYLDKSDDSFIKLIPPLTSTEILIEHRMKPLEHNLSSSFLSEELKLKRNKPVKSSKMDLSSLIKVN